MAYLCSGLGFRVVPLACPQAVPKYPRGWHPLSCDNRHLGPAKTGAMGKACTARGRTQREGSGGVQESGPGPSGLRMLGQGRASALTPSFVVGVKPICPSRWTATRQAEAEGRGKGGGERGKRQITGRRASLWAASELTGPRQHRHQPRPSSIASRVTPRRPSSTACRTCWRPTAPRSSAASTRTTQRGAG